MVNRLFQVYSVLIKIFRTNRYLTYYLFGFTPKDKNFGEYWDWTSLQIKKGIKKHLFSGMSFLDVGTGPYGLLSFFVEKRFDNVSITAIDHLQNLIKNASTQLAEHKIEFLQGDLFNNINGQYDLIVFNAPYIAIDKGKKLGVLNNKLSVERWSGGKLGTNTIERFVADLNDYLSVNGTCLLGVNHFYVSDLKIRQIIIDNHNLIINDYNKNIFTKSAVYAIRKR